MPPGETDPRYAALLALLRAADTVWSASHALFARWDLSPSQFNVLNLLGDASDGLTQTALGRALLTHRSNITGLVDRLERRGLVRRQAHNDDRRAWRVDLTPAGRRLLEEIRPHYYAAACEAWGLLTEAEARRLQRQFARLAENAVRLARKLSATSS